MPEKTHETVTSIICDKCGKVESVKGLDISVKELELDTMLTMMSVRTFFQDAGWLTSPGYDICPECR